MQPETTPAELPGRSPARGFGRWLIWLAGGYLVTGLALGNAILIQGNLAGAALTIPFAIAAILAGRDLMRPGPAPQTPRSQAGPTSLAARPLPAQKRGAALRR